MNLHQALALLELPPTATLSDAKASYKRLAKLHHPDKSDRPDADEMFKAIGAAFALVQAHHALNGGEMDEDYDMNAPSEEQVIAAFDELYSDRLGGGAAAAAAIAFGFGGGAGREGVGPRWAETGRGRSAMLAIARAEQQQRQSVRQAQPHPPQEQPAASRGAGPPSLAERIAATRAKVAADAKAQTAGST